MRNILAVCMVWLSVAGYAQTDSLSLKRWYIEANLGNNWKSGVGQFGARYYYSATNYRLTDVQGSYGVGRVVGVKTGFNIRTYVGVELGVQYVFGARYVSEGITKEVAGTAYNYIHEYEASSLRVIPALVFMYPMKKTTVYTRLGLVYSRVKDASINTQFENRVTGTVEQLEYDNLYHPRLGFTAGLGIKHSIGNRMYISAEVNTVALHHFYKSATMKSYTVNGVESVDKLPLAQRELIFDKDEFTNVDEDWHIYGDVSKPNEPSKFSSYAVNFHSIGIQLGVGFNF